MLSTGTGNPYFKRLFVTVKTNKSVCKDDVIYIIVMVVPHFFWFIISIFVFVFFKSCFFHRIKYIVFLSIFVNMFVFNKCRRLRQNMLPLRQQFVISSFASWMEFVHTLVKQSSVYTDFFHTLVVVCDFTPTLRQMLRQSQTQSHVRKRTPCVQRGI